MSQDNSPAILVISPGSSPKSLHTLSLSDYHVEQYDAYGPSDLIGFATPEHKNRPSLDTDIVNDHLRDISPLTSSPAYSSPHTSSPLSPFLPSPSPQSRYFSDYSPMSSGRVASVSLSFNSINLGELSSPASSVHYLDQPYSESSESLHQEDNSMYQSYTSFDHSPRETFNTDDGGPLGASEDVWSLLLVPDESHSSEPEYRSSQDSASQQSHIWQDQRNSDEQIVENLSSLSSLAPQLNDALLSPWHSSPLDLPPTGGALSLPTVHGIANATHPPLNIRRNRGYSIGSTGDMRGMEMNNRPSSSKRSSPYPLPHIELENNYPWPHDQNMGSHLTVPPFASSGNSLTRRHSYTHTRRPTDGLSSEHRAIYPFKQENSSINTNCLPPTTPPVHKKVASAASIMASRARRTKEANFHCDLCPQAFTTNHNLMSQCHPMHLERKLMKVDHKNAHMGIKAFVCLRCSKPFTTQSVLARHMKTCKAPEQPDSSPFSTGSRQ